MVVKEELERRYRYNSREYYWLLNVDTYCFRFSVG